MFKLLQIVCVSLCVAAAGPALAGPKMPAVPKIKLPDHEAKYVAASVVRTPDNSFDYTTLAATGQYEIAAGFGFDASFGLRQKNARIELTAVYEGNDVDGLTVSGTPIAASGTVTHKGLFLGKYWDIWFPYDAVSPYAGAGAGIVFSTFDISGPTVQIFDDSATVLGLRAAAGATVKLGANSELYGEMRYRRYGTYDITTTAGGATDEFTLDDWGYAGGVRYRF